jgi:formate hydrogenlyase subunit 6/NADH:ubiquinone oxidoreductase subunit I
MVLKSLFSKPSTEDYPAKKRAYFKNTRGSVKNRIESCIFCGICAKKCPTRALEVARDRKQWSIDRFKCIACGACVSACPKKCIDMESGYTPPATVKSVDRYTQTENLEQRHA